MRNIRSVPGKGSSYFLGHLKSVTAVLIIVVFISSCGFEKSNSTWSELPEETELDNLRETGFVLTLESPIPENKNIIYAPAFLLAWDKVEEKMKSEANAGKSNSDEFNLLVASNSHKHALNETEYDVTARVTGDVIAVSAFFNKTLPFDSKLQPLDEPIGFRNVNVAAFGMSVFNSDFLAFTQIGYYKDDDHFVLKLYPKDKQHEIILSKGLNETKTLHEAVEEVSSLIRQKEKDLTEERNHWRYEISQEDIFAIPVIKFNISTHYKKLEGQTFFTKDGKSHYVESAYQRTGLILNENGAVVESQSYVTVDSSSGEPVARQPKKMIFDKPFLIIIKRVNTENPYFVMKVNNAELLTRK